MRERLPDRRSSINAEVANVEIGGRSQKVQVTYGIDGRGEIKEVFTSSFKAGSEIETIMTDASILVSRCLQHGDTIEDLCGALSPDGLIGKIMSGGVGKQK